MYTPFRGNWFRKSLARELYENKFETHNGHNVDETGVYTMQVPGKITFAKRKNKVNYYVTSSERGTRS
jgi:hypothetical protein